MLVPPVLPATEMPNYAQGRAFLRMVERLRSMLQEDRTEALHALGVTADDIGLLLEKLPEFEYDSYPSPGAQPQSNRLLFSSLYEPLPDGVLDKLMAHELAHLMKHHIGSTISSGLSYSQGVVLIGSLCALLSGDMDAFFGYCLLSYSGALANGSLNRFQEYDADRFADILCPDITLKEALSHCRPALKQYTEQKERLFSAIPVIGPLVAHWSIELADPDRPVSDATLFWEQFARGLTGNLHPHPFVRMADSEDRIARIQRQEQTRLESMPEKARR